MFKIPYKQFAVIARYREAPLADAREQFIQKCAMQGYSHSMLCKIAWIIMSVSYSIDFQHGDITIHDIKQVIDNRKRFKNSSRDVQISQTSYQFYIHIVTEWVSSLGRLASSNEINTTFEPQITAFAKYLSDERGLSPITILTRCERLRDLKLNNLPRLR